MTAPNPVRIPQQPSETTAVHRSVVNAIAGAFVSPNVFDANAEPANPVGTTTRSPEGFLP